MQHEAGGAAATRVGAQALEIILKERLGHRLIAILAVLPVCGARQSAIDHARKISAEERLECPPAASRIAHQHIDRPRKQQVTHHERDVDADIGASVIELEAGKSVGAELCHHLTERGFGLPVRGGHPQAGSKDQVGERTRQFLRSTGRSRTRGGKQRPIRIGGAKTCFV